MNARPGSNPNPSHTSSLVNDSSLAMFLLHQDTHNFIHNTLDWKPIKLVFNDSLIIGVKLRKSTCLYSYICRCITKCFSKTI